MFSTLNGGDVYLGNAAAPIVPWHCYLPPEQTALTLQYFDPVSSNRPILLEEFGVLGWNNVSHYDASVHYALAGGAAAAMSYEWGISWLSRESCFWPLPLREASEAKSPDPRWFAPYLTLGKEWPEKGVGLCPTPSGTGYGSIYHGTPFPAAAAVALGRLGMMGEGMQRVRRNETVYVAVPAARLDALEPVKNTFKALWSMKAIFGVWQEEALESLPSSARILICPAPMAATTAGVLDTLRSRGVRVVEQAADCTGLPGFERVRVTGSQSLELLARRTAAGTLLTLVARDAGQASVSYQSHTAAFGISNFALAHITGNGVVMMEGEGRLLVDGSLFCSIDRGRLTVASEDGESLLRSRHLKLMVTEPAMLVFSRAIASVEPGDGSGNRRGSSMTGVSGKKLTIDDQLAKYIIHITFR